MSAMPVADGRRRTRGGGAGRRRICPIEYEALTPVTDARDALKPGAPQIWPETPDNLAVDWPGPAANPAANAAEVERIFASAKYVARVS